MKRKISLILAVLMLLSSVALFSSCDKSKTDGSASTTVTTLPGGNNNGGDNTDDSYLYEDLPTGNYDGYEFKTINAEIGYAINTIVPEDTSDSLDAAIYARNAYVKEKLNITMTDLLTASIASIMSALVSSNDFEYDLAFHRADSNTSLARQGAYLMIDEYEDYLNFDKPWWFTDAIDSIKIDGKGFLTFSDMHLCYYDSMWTLMFNHSDLINNKVAFPYDLVRSGDWTMEELEKIVKATYQKPGEEHFGITSHAGFITALHVACDFNVVDHDDEEILMMFEDESYFVDVYTKLKDAFFTSNGPGKMNYIDFAAGSSAVNNSAHQNYEFGFVDRFIRGMATFLSGTVGDMSGARACEHNYGYVPIPKYNDEQGQYIAMIHNGASSAGIPATSPDVERTCTILENLAAYSYKFVKYEYYDVLMQGRSVRDQDSIEMLDIIFGVDERGTARFVIDKVFSMGISVEIEKLMSDATVEVLGSIDAKRDTVAGIIEEVIEAYK